MVTGARSSATRRITEGSSIGICEVYKAFRRPDGSEMLALSRMSLSIVPGEVVSIIGPSGCGKSTLLRLIAGLDAPTDGKIIVGGQPVTGPGAERGIVFQDPNLFPWLTVRGNIEMALAASGIAGKRGRQVAEFMTLIGLEGSADAYPHHLSGGMAQRVAVARALINEPMILLLDEPFGALDAFTRMNMQDAMLRLQRLRGTTMMLVTHDVDEAIYMGDRIVLMTSRPGRVDQILNVDLPHPRQRSSVEFLQMRCRIQETFRLAGGIETTAARIQSFDTSSDMPTLPPGPPFAGSHIITKPLS